MTFILLKYNISLNANIYNYYTYLFIILEKIYRLYKYIIDFSFY